MGDVDGNATDPIVFPGYCRNHRRIDRWFLQVIYSQEKGKYHEHR